MVSFPPASPHDPIEEVFPDVFLVRGSMPLNRLMRIGRNMVVVRDGDALTILNSVRLTPEGETALERLGTVKQVIRLGYFHGRDDAYYVDRYQADFLAPAGSRTEPGPAEASVLAADSDLPFAAAEVFLWQDTKHPEAAILIKRDGGILITGDSVQYYTDRRHNNLISKLLMPLMGFPLRMLIGPFWLKAMTPAGKTLRDDFERLLTLSFEHLIPAHGSVRNGGAREALRNALALDLKN
jgi:hypothetical protein